MFVLIKINGNNSQKSWELILRTFFLQASCALHLGHSHPILVVTNTVYTLGIPEMLLIFSSVWHPAEI